jgi:putative transposase
MWPRSPRCTACCARKASWPIGARSVQRKSAAGRAPWPRPGPIRCFSGIITYLPTQVRGQHFYLYLFEDLFSRQIVGWQVFDCESAELAGQLLRDICARHSIRPGQLTVHSDNGAPMKGETMLATMQRLGVAASRSRPAVSNDNPYVESAFRTLKYRPEMPVKPFENLLAARRWVTELAHWYNHEHRHSAIGFVTPAQRHAGLDRALLGERALVYERARQENPQRWSGQPRQWAHVDVVHLNPETPQIKEPQLTRKTA